jgi:hypothetical protein
MPNEIFACLMLGEKGEAVFDQVRMTSAHLIHPLESSSFVAPTNILVEARVGTFATIPRLVEFFSGAEKIGEMTHSPYAIIWSNALAGSRSLTAKITDASGSEFFTEPANCKIKLQPASAKFLGIDDVTKGTWKNKYGIEGFHIIEHATNYPAYAHVSSGRYIRSYPTYTDSPGALQLTNENGRAFAGWLTYGSMDFEIALLDGNAHQIALYCQDWGINLRSQTIDAIDPSTGIVLDSQHAANFATGKYFIWRIQGAVKFRITQLGGSAVLSGIFFDATPP